MLIRFLHDKERNRKSLDQFLEYYNEVWPPVQVFTVKYGCYVKD